MARRSSGKKLSSSSSSSPPSSSRKRTLDLAYNNNNKGGGGGGGKNNNDADDDDHWIDSDDDDDNHDDDDDSTVPRSGDDDDEDGGGEEALEAKRIRMARKYLEKVDAVVGSSDEEEEDGESSSDRDDDDAHDDDRLGRKLQRDRMKRTGTLDLVLADKVAENVRRIHESLLLRSPQRRREQQSAEGDDLSPSQLLSETAPEEEWVKAGYVQRLKGHGLTPTCVALQSNGQRAVSGSKDHSVLLWDIEKGGHRVAALCPSWNKKKKDVGSKIDRTLGQVLSVACSDDGRYAAVGKRDATVTIYDVRLNHTSSGSGTGDPVHVFKGHKGPVTCLAFRADALDLFSGSEDRCIRHYNLREMLYLETLYGHQFGCTGMDCHLKERPVSVARDRTARAWKIAEDTHLIFRGGATTQAAECCSVIKDDWFLTGHQDGHFSLWRTDKKKPVASRSLAHGTDAAAGGGVNVPRGIVSVASVRCGDLAATGSNDGAVRLWKARTGNAVAERGLDRVGEIPVTGFVNAIAFGPGARFCVAAVGQEHKWGRWARVPGAKNRLVVCKLNNEESSSLASVGGVDDER